jgi:uncharacterized RDD family membrane protein YckC
MKPPDHELLTGRLALTTPEGIRLHLTPAGPMPRAFAWLIDFVLWLVLVLLMSYALAGNKLGQGLLTLLLFVTYWGYPILCEVYGHGQTLGKRWLGLRVVRHDGLPVGWRESSLRNLLLAADFLPVFYASGLVCMMLDPQFRRIGDLAAGTLVVYVEQAQVRQRVPQVAPLALPWPLTPAQQRTLADLFEREQGLPPSRLAELGDLAEPLTGRSGQESIEQLRGYMAGIIQ